MSLSAAPSLELLFMRCGGVMLVADPLRIWLGVGLGWVAPCGGVRCVCARVTCGAGVALLVPL